MFLKHDVDIQFNNPDAIKNPQIIDPKCTCFEE